MSRPKGNGIVELHDENRKERGFFCMELVMHLNEEVEIGTEAYADLWDERFAQAKSGQCHYADKCAIYARTMEKMSQKQQKRPIQYTLNFDF